MTGIRILTALAILGFAVSGQAQTKADPSSTSSQPQASTPAIPPRPMPPDAKVAYVDLGRIAAESADGKAARAKLAALQESKKAELQKRQEALQAVQQKIAQGGVALNEASRAQLQKESERLDRELQRATQDAQDDVTNLNRDLMNEFQRKVIPLVNRVAEEKRLHAVFSLGDTAFLWYDASLDITVDVLKRLEGGASPAANQPKP